MFRKLTNLSLALLSLHAASAVETAGDYLHRGAQKYIFGEKEKAKTEVTTGLKKFPNDEPLTKMLTLFREEEKKEQQKQDEQQQQEQKDQKDQQKKDQEQKQKQQDQQKDQQQQKQDGQKPDQSKDGKEQKQDGKDGKDEKADAKDGQPQGEPKENKDGAKPEPMPGQEDKKLSGEVKANSAPQQQQQQEEKEAAEALAEQEAAAEGKMTERQAKALLESLKSEDEKVRLLDPNERKRAGRVLRDW